LLQQLELKLCHGGGGFLVLLPKAEQAIPRGSGLGQGGFLGGKSSR
jgi:hypothetical protein